MIDHSPFPYERSSSDVDRESRGVFRVLHDKGLKLDCTYNRPLLTALNECSERPLRWLWQDKIPLGKLTLIEGPPAVGKLFVALDIAARVSNGALGGEHDGVPSSQSGATPPAPPFLRGGEHARPVGVAKSVVPPQADSRLGKHRISGRAQYNG